MTHITAMHDFHHQIAIVGSCRMLLPFVVKGAAALFAGTGVQVGAPGA